MKHKIIGLFSSWFPNLFVKIASQKLMNPQVRKLREREMAIMQTGAQKDFDFKGFTIKLYEWIGGSDRILLVHGWEGQAGNFADIIPILQERNYSIFTFDGPGHGFSSRGKTNVFEFAELVGVLIKKYRVPNLISHSFGGVACTYALYKNQDIHLSRYLLLTTPNRFLDRIEDVCESVGFHRKVKLGLIRKLEKGYNISVSQLNVSDFVKKINVGKGLIIHDEKDRVIPLEKSRIVSDNWDNCTLEIISGTGHFRILRDSKVIEMVIDFFGAE